MRTPRHGLDKFSCFCNILSNRHDLHRNQITCNVSINRLYLCTHCMWYCSICRYGSFVEGRKCSMFHSIAVKYLGCSALTLNFISEFWSGPSDYWLLILIIDPYYSVWTYPGRFLIISTHLCCHLAVQFGSLTYHIHSRPAFLASVFNQSGLDYLGHLKKQSI